MNRLELIKLLSSAEEEEVLIDINGTLCEIEIYHIPECFDGSLTSYPAVISLIPDTRP